MKLNLKGLNQEEKTRAKQESGIAIVDGINDFLDQHVSPVSGGRFKQKKADGTLSSLFEFGDMRAQITFEELETDHVEVGIFADAPTKERLKAFNHGTGDTVPKREFIAAPNKKFKKVIMDSVNTIVGEIKEEAKAKKEIEDDLVQTILEPEDLLEILGG